MINFSDIVRGSGYSKEINLFLAVCLTWAAGYLLYMFRPRKKGKGVQCGEKHYQEGPNTRQDYLEHELDWRLKTINKDNGEYNVFIDVITEEVVRDVDDPLSPSANDYGLTGNKIKGAKK